MSIKWKNFSRSSGELLEVKFGYFKYNNPIPFLSFEIYASPLHKPTKVRSSFVGVTFFVYCLIFPGKFLQN